MINVEGLKDFADIFKDMYRDTMSVFVMLITSMVPGRLVEIMYLAFTPHARVRVSVHDSAGLCGCAAFGIRSTPVLPQ